LTYRHNVETLVKHRFFDSLLKPFVHWLLHRETNFLDTLVQRHKVKRIPHLKIVSITVVAIGTTFCYADGSDMKKIRTLFLVNRKLKFLCRVCSVIVHPERKSVLFRKLKCSSISCGCDCLVRESVADRHFPFNYKYSEVIL